jgi:NADH-quinone oxidoreductase subunit N
MVFRAAVDAGQVPLVIIGVLASLVSVYYYLRIPVMMYMRDPSGAALRQESSLGELLVLWVCAASALFFGIFPGGALEWARRGAALLF